MNVLGRHSPEGMKDACYLLLAARGASATSPRPNIATSASPPIHRGVLCGQHNGLLDSVQVWTDFHSCPTIDCPCFLCAPHDNSSRRTCKQPGTSLSLPCLAHLGRNVQHISRAWSRALSVFHFSVLARLATFLANTTLATKTDGRSTEYDFTQEHQLPHRSHRTHHTRVPSHPSHRAPSVPYRTDRV